MYEINSSASLTNFNLLVFVGRLAPLRYYKEFKNPQWLWQWPWQEQWLSSPHSIDGSLRVCLAPGTVLCAVQELYPTHCVLALQGDNSVGPLEITFESSAWAIYSYERIAYQNSFLILSIPYPLEILKKNTLKFPFKTKFFSCILFLQDHFFFIFSQNCVHMVLQSDVKSATLDCRICIWFGYSRGNDSTVRENTTAS